MSSPQIDFDHVCREEKRLHDRYRQQTEELRVLNQESPRTYRQWQEMLESRAMLLKRFPFLKG